MAGFQMLTRPEQVADYPREELRQGRWRGWMPGVLKLECGSRGMAAIFDR